MWQAGYSPGRGYSERKGNFNEHEEKYKNTNQGVLTVKARTELGELSAAVCGQPHDRSGDVR